MKNNDRHKSFVLYDDYAYSINKLTMEERGQLLTNMFAVRGELAPVEITDRVDMFFTNVALQMERDAVKFAEECERRAIAGRKGGLARAANQSQPQLTNANQVLALVSETTLNRQTAYQTLPNQADNDNETVNETDAGDEKGRRKEKGPFVDDVFATIDDEEDLPF